MSLLKNNIIRKRVLAIIETRIQQAQTKYDEGCETLNEKYGEEVQTAVVRRDQGKTDLQESLVKNIIGKIL